MCLEDALQIIRSEGLMGVRTLLGAPAPQAAGPVPAGVPAFAGEGSLGWGGTKSNGNHQGAGDGTPSTSQVWKSFGENPTEYAQSPQDTNN